MNMENFNIAPRKKFPVDEEKAKRTYEREEIVKKTEESLEEAFGELDEKEIEAMFERIKKSRKSLE